MNGTVSRGVITRWFSRLLVLGLVLYGGQAQAFTLEVVDSDGVPIPIGFRWLVEQDNTNQKPPGESSARSSGVSIHKSYAPVIAEGDSGDQPTAKINVADTKRYVVSALPYDGYTMGAALIAKGQNKAKIVVHKLPLPTTQLSILVFQDHGPINNAPDRNAFEPGLPGFSIKVNDAGGEVLQDAFGNPLGTTYVETCDASGQNPGSGTAFCLDGGDPVVDVAGNGTLLTDANGELTIKYLAPGKYGILAVVPPDQSGDWVQTATIEGTRTVDVWVKADEPARFIEGFGPGFYHVFIGFVNNSLLPWNAAPDVAATGTISGVNRFNHFSRPPNLQGFFAGPGVDGCWVGLNDPATGQGLYAAPCENDSSFTISNVPPGTYELVTWDENLDALFGFKTVTVTNNTSVSGDDVDLGNVLSFRWFGTLKGNIFLDVNENGFRDPGEVGLPSHDVLLRFRNGSIYQATVSDIFGEYELSEVFPFFKWLVTEVGFGTMKATGMTAVIDNGGPVDPTDPFAIAAGINTTGWPADAIGVLNPQPQFKKGTISYDAATNTYQGTPKNNPNTGNNLSRTETGPVLTEAMHLFLNQTNLIDWGKNNYSPGENGGISGLVIYDITRPNNDPAAEAQENHEPGIPNAQVVLYLDDDGDGTIDDNDGDGKVRRADVDNAPQGNFPGPEDLDRNKNGSFDWNDAVNVVYTDSWDASLPQNCVQSLPVIDGVEARECFDNFGTWNQVRPGIFDGGYAFTSYFPKGPNGKERSPLPEKTYIVEAPTPPGYVLAREEDKNVDFGETFTPSPLLLPPPCVGKPHTVQAYMSFQTDDNGTPLPGIATEDLVEAPFAGEVRPLCDLKQVDLVEGQNAAAEFYFFTKVPKAARVVGFVNNDLSAEFDKTSPIFGEKSAPKWLPVSFRDFAGVEVARVYADEYGTYNSMLPSMFSNSIPSPSGFAPNMLTMVLNDPGPIPDPANPGQMIIDPHYDSDFAVSPWTLHYTPGQVTYADTPIVPVGAFATVPPGATLQSAPPVGTPIIASVERKLGPGEFAAPVLCTETVEPIELILRKLDYNVREVGQQTGFGNDEGTVQIVDPATGTTYPLEILSWASDKVKVEVLPEVIEQLVTAGVTAGPLMLTRGDNGLSTEWSLTLHLRDCTVDPPIVVAQDGTGNFTTIQAAIDDPATVAGDLIMVRPGIYNENVILYKEVTLQGSGSYATIINAVPEPRNRMDDWHAKVLELLGTDPFLANEGPGIMVLGNAVASPFVAGEPHARIDGLRIIGALAGGGIYLDTDAVEVEISNNVLTGNQGTFGGGITVGTPDTGLTYNNDAVHIHHNYITKNGGVQGGGGINLYSGADSYLVEHNFISANFSRFTGAGINHVGLSAGGVIDRNQILFNEVQFGGLLQGAGDGAGIYLGGEIAGGEGAGDVTISNNLIQGNLAGSGYGGGIATFAFNSAGAVGDYRLQLLNNTIVNNVAGLAGGGVYLSETVHADIINNTIVNNDSTATAALAFAAGALNSTPQPAGLVIASPLAALAATVTPDFGDFNLVNNFLWHNRAFFNDASLNNGAGGLQPADQFTTVQADPTVDYPAYWDLQLLGGGDGLAPANNLLSQTTRTLAPGVTTGPAWDYSADGNVMLANDSEIPYQFRKAYLNELVTATVLDEGGNAITVRYTPLDATAGDYHLLPSSTAVDAGQPVAPFLIDALLTDSDDEVRPNGLTAEDIGADEYYQPDAAAVTVLSPNGTTAFGKDELLAGTTFPVCWEAPAMATSFKVKLSLDNGVTWSNLSTTETGPCYDWAIPAAGTLQKGLIRVLGFAGPDGDKVGEDVSDAKFRILPGI